jgi:hypothetical protein
VTDWHNTDPRFTLHSSLDDHSRLPSRSMARLPPAAEPREDTFSQKPSLPSLSKFLSDAGHPDLFTSTRTQHGRTEPPPAPAAAPYHHPVAPPAAYRPPELNPQGPSEPYNGHLWSYSNSNHVRAHPQTVSAQYAAERPPAPRAPREEMIPGRGLCYVYEDGTMIQKTINGDTVNPKWGTTKAGKPRKRLGQACNTCREKKIKCDPSVPKCAQCQKFGRECKFDSTYGPVILFRVLLMLIPSQVTIGLQAARHIADDDNLGIAADQPHATSL